MDLSFSPEYEAFRKEVADILSANAHLAPTSEGAEGGLYPPNPLW